MSDQTPMEPVDDQTNPGPSASAESVPPQPAPTYHAAEQPAPSATPEQPAPASAPPAALPVDPTAQPTPTYQPSPPAGYVQPQAPVAPTNVLAIITIIAAFFIAPAGIVTGHIALSQIKRSGEQGRGLALAGLILSYVFTAFIVLTVVLFFILMAVAIAQDPYSYSYSSSNIL